MEQNDRKNIVVVSSYTRFDNLAHKPRGTESEHGMYSFDLDINTGRLTLLSVTSDGVMNPSFSRYHPNKKVLYTVTESIKENGQVVAYDVNHRTGRLTKLQEESAGGTSTCYVTLTKNHMILTNYWDSSLAVLPLDPNGTIGPLKHVTKMPNIIRAKHLSDHLSDRQSEPHNHSLVFEPFHGNLAFVPDLGTDTVRQFLFDDQSGQLTYVNSVPTAADVVLGQKKGHGPRYIVFHEIIKTAYVINELSNTVSVFRWDEEAYLKIIAGDKKQHALKLVQNISTIPEGFDSSLSKCGRICFSPTGKFVLASNRGHDSITSYRIANDGRLVNPKWCHINGQTPRHFQFDNSGQWIIACAQDSDCVNVLRFNSGTGRITYSGNSHRVPSPNFASAEFASYPTRAKFFSPL